MKILVVTQKVDRDDPILGFFHRWLEKLAEGADLFVIANQTGGHGLPENVKIYSLGKEHGKGRLARFFRYQILLFKLLPQVQGVFFHMCPEYVLAAGFWPKLFRKKTLLWYTHGRVGRKLKFAEKFVDKIFTASPESFRLPSKKVVVTGHGIDTRHFKLLFRTPGAVLKLLAVGRIAPSKNLEFLIESLDILRKEASEREITLDIVGSPVIPADYEYQERIKALIKTKGLGAMVAFLGSKPYDEMPAVYAEHDILLHASETGSIDKVVIEAMAAGLLVVSTSEAFYDVLPNKYSVREKNPAKMAEKIMVLKAARQDPMLREIVLKNHNLDKLLSLILNAFR